MQDPQSLSTGSWLGLMVVPRALHERPLFEGTPQQGGQSPITPAMLYRQGLAALDNYCRAAFSGNSFATLSVEQKDKVLVDLERDLIQLDGVNGSAFFKQVLTNTREGFFADPLYGGNHDMAGWKMIGFPGARYDYRDWVERHNQRYPLPPVNIMVIVGLGWTGSILAHELASAGLNVVALERGRWRSTPTGFPTT